MSPSCISRRLLEVCVGALARWVDTYLLPEEPLPDALEASLGAAGAAPAIQDACVQIVAACLSLYPGEAELHRQVRRVHCSFFVICIDLSLAGTVAA